FYSQSLLLSRSLPHLPLHPFPTRRSSDLRHTAAVQGVVGPVVDRQGRCRAIDVIGHPADELALSVQAHELDSAPLDRATEVVVRSEEHTSELQSLRHLVCRLLLEKKKNTY